MTTIDCDCDLVRNALSFAQDHADTVCSEDLLVIAMMIALLKEALGAPS